MAKAAKSQIFLSQPYGVGYSYQGKVAGGKSYKHTRFSGVEVDEHCRIA